MLLEYEDRFPYRYRLKSIAAPDALTPRQVTELNRVAHSLGIQIIPLVQCLGHLTYVLRLPQFRRLAEDRSKASPYTVCPAAPGSRTLFREMSPRHADNVVGAARAATDNRSLGCVITSWALRRSPWPLTEYTLIAGSLAMKDPQVSRKAIDMAFVLKHFGVSDLRLARLPDLLGWLYTTRTLHEEQQSRFGSLEDYLRDRTTKAGAGL